MGETYEPRTGIETAERDSLTQQAADGLLHIMVLLEVMSDEIEALGARLARLEGEGRATRLRQVSQ